MNNFGISNSSYSVILEYFKQNTNIKKVVVFGSRAMGNYKNGSDIDFAIWGDELLETKIKADLEELKTPYMYDVVVFDDLQKEELKNHIMELGKVFYE
ncbi:MAG: nucleotidyltransferase domain-containing protein [Alphaproteobacteria bacterium]